MNIVHELRTVRQNCDPCDQCVELMENAAQEIERLRAERADIVRWMLDEFQIGHDGYQDGCISGDCPHERGSECVRALLERFEAARTGVSE